LSRRQLVWLVAIVSQIAVIGGFSAWSYYLTTDVTGALPTSVSAVITVWVSDPGWQVAPELIIGQNTWTVTLSTPQGSSFGASHPDAEAVLVLWDDAELSNPQPACLFADVGLNCTRSMSSVAPGSYRQIQVPKDEADPYVEQFFSGTVPGFPGPTVPAQIFRVTAHDYYSVRSHSLSVFPVIGQASPSIKAATSTGWSAYVPMAADAGIFPGGCSADSVNLPPAIAAAIGPAPQSWYGTPCPSPKVELFTGPGERFSDSTVPPTSTDEDTIPTWTDQPQSPGKIATYFVGGFWLDVADPAIAASAQRGLFLAGVLAGIAGGLLATWLAAGATLIVKRSTAPRSQPSGAAGGGPLPEPPPRP
jgi:hypothetical protein